MRFGNLHRIIDAYRNRNAAPAAAPYAPAPDFGFQGFQGGQAQVLYDYLLPAFQGSQGDVGRIERLLEGRLNQPADFRGYSAALEKVATGISDELFAPGGQVDTAYRGALGESTASGFGTSSGSVDRARQNILLGARDVIGRGISQAAPQIAGLAEQARAGDIAALLDYHTGAANRNISLLESLYGAQAGIQQYGLARDQLGLNRQILEQYLKNQGGGGFLGGLGSFLGAVAGSAAGPIGGAIGGAIGGKITGLFDGE